MSLSTFPEEAEGGGKKQQQASDPQQSGATTTTNNNNSATTTATTTTIPKPDIVKKNTSIGGKIGRASMQEVKRATNQVKKATKQVKKATLQVRRAQRFAGDYLTNSRLFEQLVDNIFMRVDLNKDGLLGQEELYSAILLIHLKLAKHVGPAACSPPKRKTVLRLFNASDLTNTGYIDREEFNNIAKMCCTQILGRIATYWFCMVFFAPLLAHWSCDYYDLPEGSLRERAMEKVLSIGLMAIVLPFIWEIVDDKMERNALLKKEEISSMDEVIHDKQHDD